MAIAAARALPLKLTGDCFPTDTRSKLRFLTIYFVICLAAMMKFTSAFVTSPGMFMVATRRYRQTMPRRISLSTSCDTSIVQNRSSLLSLDIPTPQDMEEVGALLSQITRPGDVILLGGDLGAGKTCFSRGFVRGKTGDWDQSVTSPTYLLSNTYQTEKIEIRHMDLYRLSGEARDLKPLDLDHVFSSCVSLVEWPSRLGSSTPEVRLEIDLTIPEVAPTISPHDEIDDEVTRRMTLRPHGGEWDERLQYLLDEGYLDDLLATDDSFRSS